MLSLGEHMNSIRPRHGTRLSKARFLALSIILAASLIACENETSGISGLDSYTCDVTLTLAPSSINGLSSPEGSGRGSGKGTSQQEALRNALAVACTQLPLSSSEVQMCRAGENFIVVDPDNPSLASAVNRSVRCRSG